MDSIIFDMDGVIFDTEALTSQLWQSVVEEYDIQDISCIYPLFIGKCQKDVEKIFRHHYGNTYPVLEIQAKVSYQLQAFIAENGPPMKTNVTELLHYLKSAQYRIALASSSPSSLIKMELSMAHLIQYFDVIIGGDMVIHGKPAPDIFLSACHQLKCNPKESLVIEDSENGIRAAHAARIPAIMIPDLIAPTAELEKMCLKVLPDLSSLQDFLSNEYPLV